MKKEKSGRYCVLTNHGDRKTDKEINGHFKLFKQVLKAVANFLGASSEPNESEKKLKDIYKWMS